MTNEAVSNTVLQTGRSFQRVLFVFSGDEADEDLLPTITWLSRNKDLEVSVLAIVEPLPDIGRIAHVTGLSREEIESRLYVDKRDAVAALIEKASSGKQPPVHIRAGRPFVEIIRHVIRNKIDLVIKTAEELHGIRHHLYSSTDQHLLRKCPSPVWLRRNNTPAAPKTIVAAVDTDVAVASEPKTLAGLNQHIMDTAIAMAGQHEAIIHLLHVWEAPAEGLVRRWSGSADAQDVAESYVTEVHSSHRHALNELAKQSRLRSQSASAPPLTFRPTLKRGTARQKIPEYVSECKAELLILGTIARTGVPGFIIGNTAEDVLNSVECSVVTVKPPGYVSPIEA